MTYGHGSTRQGGERRMARIMQNLHKVTNQRRIFPPALIPDGPLATVFSIGTKSPNQHANHWPCWW